MTERTRKLRLVLALVAVLAFAYWLPLPVLDWRYPETREPIAMHALARELRVGPTQAETLTFLRAKGFSETDLRIYRKAPGPNTSDIAGTSLDNPAGGDQIHAQSGRYFALGPNPQYFRLIRNFDTRGLLVEAKAQGMHTSLADDDARYTPGKSVVSTTTLPPR